MTRALHIGPLAGVALTMLFAMLFAAPACAQDGGGVTLNQYRAAPTPQDGLAVSRAYGLGHVELGARLDVDYAYQPLRVIGVPDEDVLVDHQVSGQLGLALGLLDQFVGWVRLPVTFVMDGTSTVAGDPIAQAFALGDLTLGARWVLFGEDEDEEILGVALATEAALPTAEGADDDQDLAGEMGPSFAPELDVELRFSPVRIRAELGLRFRDAARYQRLPVGNELFWGAGVDVDIAPGVIEASLEVFGATPLDDFARQRRSPIEALLGARVHPGAGLTVHAGVGAGLGNGYGAPRVRALLGLGWVSDFGTPAPVRESTASSGGEDGGADGDDEEALAEPARDDEEAAPAAEEAPPEDTRPAGTAPPPSVDLDAAYANLDRDGDRIVDAHDRCPLDREDYDEIQDDDGCPEDDADQDRVADVSDMCPLTPGVDNDDESCRGCPELACVSDEGTITISERVEFATGSDRILEGSEDVLEAVRSILDTNPQIVGIRIEGHTDDRDSDQHNLTLSSGRAASVRAWLVEHGLDVSRFQAWGCGEAHPIEDNRTRRGRQANRRVEFHIVDPPTAGYTPREGCQRAE